jgi:hypothetical protein
MEFCFFYETGKKNAIKRELFYKERLLYWVLLGCQYKDWWKSGNLLV